MGQLVQSVGSSKPGWVPYLPPPQGTQERRLLSPWATKRSCEPYCLRGDKGTRRHTERRKKTERVTESNREYIERINQKQQTTANNNKQQQTTTNNNTTSAATATTATTTTTHVPLRTIFARGSIGNAQFIVVFARDTIFTIGFLNAGELIPVFAFDTGHALHGCICLGRPKTLFTIMALPFRERASSSTGCARGPGVVAARVRCVAFRASDAGGSVALKCVFVR